MCALLRECPLFGQGLIERGHATLSMAKYNKYGLHTEGEVAISLSNQARGVQPACTMTTKFKNQVDK